MDVRGWYVGCPAGAHPGEVLPQPEVPPVEPLAGAHGVEEVGERVAKAMLQELLVLRRQLGRPRPGGHDELHVEALCARERHDGPGRRLVELRQILTADQRGILRDGPQAPRQSCQRFGFAWSDEAAARL